MGSNLPRTTEMTHLGATLPKQHVLPGNQCKQRRLLGAGGTCRARGQQCPAGPCERHYLGLDQWSVGGGDTLMPASHDPTTALITTADRSAISANYHCGQTSIEVSGLRVYRTHPSCNIIISLLRFKLFWIAARHPRS